MELMSFIIGFAVGLLFRVNIGINIIGNKTVDKNK